MRRRLAATAVLVAALLAPAPALASASTLTSPTLASQALASSNGSRSNGSSGDIVDVLQHIPGVTYLGENPAPPAGFRYFNLEFRQPVDHHHPEKGTFEQHLILLHRDVTAPMVVYTSGYFNYDYTSEPTRIVGGNQLSIEHRFFGDSVPDPLNWHDLDIWQEAADEHAIVTALKPVYRAKWLATGVSKGGMTAVFHDRFYPQDYAGTLAYSSPDDITDRGSAYADFLGTVGTPQCRADLRRVQVQALQQRGPLETLMSQAAATAGETFTKDVGSLDKAFEFDVIGMPFVFWQYGNLDFCADIPAADASVQELYDFYDATVGWLADSDQENDPFLAFDYQAGTQLDYPVQPQSYLLGLLRYPYQESARAYVPRSIPMHFDPSAMPDIDNWVRAHGAHLIFTYGSIDPYSATPFRLGHGTKDSAIYTLAGGNHLSTISTFPAAVQTSISNTLRRWAGLSPATTTLHTTALPRA